MPEASSLADLLQPGESAVAVFTRGHCFNPDDVTGTSGKWRMGRDRKPTRLIVYRRKGRAGQLADLFIADYAGLHPSDEARRSLIKYTNLRQLPGTRLTWPSFSGSRSVVRYVRS